MPSKWLRMSRMRESLRLLSIVLTVASASFAQGDIDADLVQRRTVGPAPASAATSASTVSRSRRADFAFPGSMKVQWRARVTGPITLEPVVDRVMPLRFLKDLPKDYPERLRRVILSSSDDLMRARRLRER